MVDSIAPLIAALFVIAIIYQGITVVRRGRQVVREFRETKASLAPEQVGRQAVAQADRSAADMGQLTGGPSAEAQADAIERLLALGITVTGAIDAVSPVIHTHQIGGVDLRDLPRDDLHRLLVAALRHPALSQGAPGGARSALQAQIDAAAQALPEEASAVERAQVIRQVLDGERDIGQFE